MLSYESAVEGVEGGTGEQGLEAGDPKEVFRQAFEAGWLRAEAPWLTMIQDRNLVEHTYNERTAEEVRRHVDAAIAALREALGVLTEHST